MMAARLENEKMLGFSKMLFTPSAYHVVRDLKNYSVIVYSVIFMTWYCLFIAGCGPSPISQGFLTPATRNFGPGTSYSLPSQCRHRKEQTKSVL